MVRNVGQKRSEMVLHRTAEEHFQKLKRVYERLMREMHKDDLDDFIKTAWHLCEIVEKDTHTTRKQRRAVNSLRKTEEMRLCQDITNAQKHFTLRGDQIDRAEVRKGWGVGRYGCGSWGRGEQSVTIHLKDGQEIKALSFVSKVFGVWRNVFEEG